MRRIKPSLRFEVYWWVYFVRLILTINFTWLGIKRGWKICSYNARMHFMVQWLQVYYSIASSPRYEGNRVQAKSVRPQCLQHHRYGIANDDLFSRGWLQYESLQQEIQLSHNQMALQGVKKNFPRRIRKDRIKERKFTRVFGNDSGLQDTWSIQDHNIWLHWVNNHSLWEVSTWKE